jgi:hypothetical protein
MVTLFGKKQFQKNILSSKILGRKEIWRFFSAEGSKTIRAARRRRKFFGIFSKISYFPDFFWNNFLFPKKFQNFWNLRNFWPRSCLARGGVRTTRVSSQNFWQTFFNSKP